MIFGRGAPYVSNLRRLSSDQAAELSSALEAALAPEADSAVLDSLGSVDSWEDMVEGFGG